GQRLLVARGATFGRGSGPPAPAAVGTGQAGGSPHGGQPRAPRVAAPADRQRYHAGRGQLPEEPGCGSTKEAAKPACVKGRILFGGSAGAGRGLRAVFPGRQGARSETQFGRTAGGAD